MRTLTLALALAAGCAEAPSGSASEPSTEETATLPTTGPAPTTPEPTEPCARAGVDLADPFFYPEGVDVDAAGTLYVSSISTGSVFRSVGCDTTASLFAQLSAAGHSALGVLVDEDNGWLWVADGDFYAALDPAVEAFDLETGVSVARHPLAGGFGFANDLAFGPDGALYVTETFTSTVYVIAADDLGTGAQATPWAAPAEAAPGPYEFGFNGIVADGDALIVAQTTQGLLYRIPIEADGSAGVAEALPLAGAIAGPDGLEPLQDGRIAIVEQGANRVTAVDLDTGALEVLAEGLDVPTTTAATDGALWVVEGQLDHLLGYDPSAPDPFHVRRFEL